MTALDDTWRIEIKFMFPGPIAIRVAVLISIASTLLGEFFKLKRSLFEIYKQRALILFIQTLALYKSFTYLLT